MTQDQTHIALPVSVKLTAFFAANAAVGAVALYMLWLASQMVG